MRDLRRLGLAPAQIVMIHASVRAVGPVIDGARIWVDCEEFDTSDRGVHENWPDRAFALIVDDFIATAAGTPACSTSRVGLTQSVLVDAAALVAHALPIMTAWANGQNPSPSTSGKIP